MNLLFLFASIGVVNGVIVATYILFRKSKVAEMYFAGLLLSLCIRIGKSIFYYFNRDADPLILQIGLSACIFIGPFFYLYLKTLNSNQSKPSLKDQILLITLFTAVTALGIVYPYRQYPEIWNQYIIQGIYIIWMFFVVLGSIRWFEIFKNRPKSQKFNRNEQYLLAIVMAMIFITGTYQMALFIGFTYLWGSLIFTFTFYYLLGRILTNAKPITPRAPKELEGGQQLLLRIDQIMRNKKPYTKQGLKLDDLADLAEISKHQLSMILNEVYEKGFNHYIKEHRVKEAKALIANRPELSLEGIGYEAGFGSKSVFFESFRTMEKMTPAEFRRALMIQATVPNGSD